MHVLISADMEGVTGVTWPEDVAPGVAFALPTMAEVIRCFRAVSALAAALTQAGYG